jgi:hypothetical protein
VGGTGLAESDRKTLCQHLLAICMGYNTPTAAAAAIDVKLKLIFSLFSPHFGLVPNL